MQTWERLKSNSALFEKYFIKEYMYRAFRKFFEEHNYHEIEVPILTDSLPQERYLDVLHTNIAMANGTSHKAYLIPSTETWNKRILAAGIGNHFVISKVFRGLEEISDNHSPEFTMMEWYTLGKDYKFLMDQAEELIRYTWKYVQQNLNKDISSSFVYQGNIVELDKPWYRFSVPGLLKKHLNVTLDQIDTTSKFAHALKVHFAVAETDDWQTMFELFMSIVVEPKLPQDRPVFIHNFPKLLCPLTKQSEADKNVSEKVELYILNKEVANGYTELTDWEVQKDNFDKEQKARADLGKESVKYDTEIIKALKLGMPEVAGIGMGVDRLAMLFADVKSIADVNYFPSKELFGSCQTL